jgi:ketosteroid isomerase-like protein
LRSTVVAMEARTPEELDALLEDAFVVRDREAVAELFDDDALVVDGISREARGTREIGGWATHAWSAGLTYVGADPQVLQARDTALVLMRRGIGVARRRDGRGWRYAIALLSTEDRRKEEEP